MANGVLPNITLDAIQTEYNSTASAVVGEKKVNGFNEKNYLNTRLGKGEKTKELTIRLLPMSATEPNPFIHVHFHNVEVPKEMVEQGKKPFKSYICLSPYWNPTIDHKTYGDKCPFCEENAKAYNDSLKATTEEERKALVDHSLDYKAKEAIIVRCIDRDHEDEGVKFWKFNLKHDKSDPYHKILSIVEKRRQESIRATGQEMNILDLNSGRDFTITITEGNTDNQTSINVVEAGFDTPLSRDPEQALAWINDTKVWQDVFTVKPYEYLKLILDGKYPWFDRTQNKWIDKAEYDARRNNSVAQANQDIAAAEAAVRNGYYQNPTVGNTVAAPVPPVQTVNQAPIPVETRTELSGEDLPF